MSRAIETMDGAFCLHTFKNFNWNAWKYLPEDERQDAIEEFSNLISKWEKVEDEKEGSQLCYKVVGHKADLMAMIVRETVDELIEIEMEIKKSKLGSYLIDTDSYFSVVEIAKYRYAKYGDNPEQHPEVRELLYPILPKLKYMSVYPMKRRRSEYANWYELENRERLQLLGEHAQTGRKYLDTMEQITTGSVGLDKWEWVISLFTDDAIQLKKIVYEMRFDRASFQYGEFGDFYIGKLLTKDSLHSFLNIK